MGRQNKQTALHRPVCKQKNAAAATTHNKMTNRRTRRRRKHTEVLLSTYDYPRHMFSASQWSKILYHTQSGAELSDGS
jgi:hypothetical protein